MSPHQKKTESVNKKEEYKPKAKSVNKKGEYKPTTIKERIKLVQLYYSNECNAAKATRIFQEENNRELSSNTTRR